MLLCVVLLSSYGEVMWLRIEACDAVVLTEVYYRHDILFVAYGDSIFLVFVVGRAANVLCRAQLNDIGLHGAEHLWQQLQVGNVVGTHGVVYADR